MTSVELQREIRGETKNQDVGCKLFHFTMDASIFKHMVLLVF